MTSQNQKLERCISICSLQAVRAASPRSLKKNRHCASSPQKPKQIKICKFCLIKSCGVLRGRKEPCVSVPELKKNRSKVETVNSRMVRLQTLWESTWETDELRVWGAEPVKLATGHGELDTSCDASLLLLSTRWRTHVNDCIVYHVIRKSDVENP